MSPVPDDRHGALIDALRTAREAARLSQADIAARLGWAPSAVARVETCERRLDVIELQDWLAALGVDGVEFLIELGWKAPAPAGPAPAPEVRSNAAALPVRGQVEAVLGGVLQILTWQGQRRTVELAGITAEQYVQVEAHISALFSALSDGKTDLKGREVIHQALNHAITALPGLNPSDIYHHIVYRLFLRDYRRSKPEQSWVRAGGEAMELFVQEHYTPLLAPHGIRIQALFSGKAKAGALAEMGLAGIVGDSKLDVVLYGTSGLSEVLFGGVHCKASLAERVPDLTDSVQR